MEIESEHLRKRDLKALKKRTKHRRLSNSNLIIPTSDDSESSASDESNLSDGQYSSKKNRKVFIENKAMINQCTACAGYHDLNECVNRRGN